MTAKIKKKELSEQLQQAVEKFRLLSAASMNFSDNEWQECKKELDKIYYKGNRSIISPYLVRSIDRRANPLKERPWAKSFICIAVPLDIIPSLNLALPEVRTKASERKMAAYSKRLDYHIFCEETMKLFISELNPELALTKLEICVDTKAVPEKILAKFAGLGDIGYNNCLVCKGSSSFFIAIAFLEADLPSVQPEKQKLPCHECGRCVSACPGAALTKEGFHPEKCISFLTMEKKSDLNEAEKKIIGNNIFGCDICISSCPKSKMTAPLKIDSEWLESLDEEGFIRIFKNSPCLYAKLERLKRNSGNIPKSSRSGASN
ncbi:MAG TPA: DUF1730 domain-containing protein [Victivallales bacterium]|nr:DUF1730 domain-containing protein [Victivallales bacterium]